MDLIKALKERRSIRKYKPDAIADMDLEEVLEAARWAPSWANTQCWELIVIKDSDTKKRLAETMSSGNPACSAVSGAPIVIVACAQVGKAGYFKGKPVTDKGDWCMFDVALVMHSLTLAAHARGLGTVHIGFFDAKEVARLLDVPEGVTVVEMTPLGYPEGTVKPPPRKALKDFVSYEKFGSR